jgi:hypothetical protein
MVSMNGGVEEGGDGREGQGRSDNRDVNIGNG